MLSIEWTESAIEDLKKLDKPISRRVLTRITWFSSNFERVIPEPLTGEFKGTFKLRIGEWRVVYTVEGKTILIQFIGHRRNIYKTK